MVFAKTLKDRECLKRTAYQIALLRQQADSEFKINRGGVPSRNRFTPEAVERSTVARGCDHRNGDTYFLKGRMNAPSASQITVAAYLNKTRQTVVKWAKRIPHVHLYKRVKLSNTIPQHHFQCYQTTRNGNRRRIEYRRLPNYYYPEIKAKREQRTMFRTPDRPADRQDATTNETALNAKLSIRQSPNTNFVQKIAALGLDLSQTLACDILSETSGENKSFPMDMDWPALKRLLLDMLDSADKEELAVIYHKTNQYCGVASPAEPTSETLDWFFRDRNFPEYTGSAPLTEMPPQAKKKACRTFTEKLSELTTNQVQKLAHSLMKAIQEKDRPDVLEANRSSLVDALHGTVPMLTLPQQQLLMVMTDRVYKGKLPATQHMVSGMVSFAGQADQPELRRYFSPFI